MHLRFVPAVLASALGAALLIVMPVFADRYAIDDDVSAGSQHVRDVSVAPGTAVELGGRLLVTRSGSNHMAAGGQVTFRLARETNAPADLRADDVVVTIPATWDANGQTAEGTYRVTFTAPAQAGDASAVLKWAPVEAYGNALTGSDNLVINLHVAPPARTATPAPRDTTAPTISAARNPGANDAGWNNGDVTVSFSCSDGESGVASCSGPVALSTDGANQSATGTAADNAGNTASTTLGGINIDKTAPTIAGARSVAANLAGWNNGDVTVSFACGDALSGVASCASPVALSAEGANQSANGSAADNAGNTASTTLGGINIDKTAPTIAAARSAANAAGWNNGDVTVTFTCGDNLSGVASCPASVVVSAEGAGQSVSGTALDVAGNSASAGVGGINVDKTRPTVSYGGNAGTYTVDQTVAIQCNSADALSGVAATTCQGANGRAYTFPLGANGLAASATDKAGNTGNGSTSFTIKVTSGSLCNLTREFVSNAGIAQSLCAKLAAADAAKARGAMSAFSGAIGAYGNEVDAQTGKSITAANAAILKRLAAAL